MIIMSQELHLEYVSFCNLAASFAANSRRTLPSLMSELYQHLRLKNEGKLLGTVTCPVLQESYSSTPSEDSELGLSQSICTINERLETELHVWTIKQSIDIGYCVCAVCAVRAVCARGIVANICGRLAALK
jgi:hypothetical protein